MSSLTSVVGAALQVKPKLRPILMVGVSCSSGLGGSLTNVSLPCSVAALCPADESSCHFQAVAGLLQPHCTVENLIVNVWAFSAIHLTGVSPPQVMQGQHLLQRALGHQKPAQSC